MEKISRKYRTLVISIFSFLGLLAVASGNPAQANDYSVGGNGWTAQNNWNNYWTNNPKGNANWNDNTHHYNTMNNTWHANTGGYNTGASNTNTNYHPKVVHGLPPQVKTGQDMYNVQTGQWTGVKVYSQSVTPHAFKTTICAQDNVNGQSVHLGCVPEAPFTSAANGPARFDFNVWPANTGGNHSVSLTYRDAYGNWRPIQTPWNQNNMTNVSI